MRNPDSHANNMPIGDTAKGSMPVNPKHNTVPDMKASMGEASSADLRKGYTQDPMYDYTFFDN